MGSEYQGPSNSPPLLDAAKLTLTFWRSGFAVSPKRLAQGLLGPSASFYHIPFPAPISCWLEPGAMSMGWRRY